MINKLNNLSERNIIFALMIIMLLQLSALCLIFYKSKLETSYPQFNVAAEEAHYIISFYKKVPAANIKHLFGHDKFTLYYPNTLMNVSLTKKPDWPNFAINQQSLNEALIMLKELNNGFKLSYNLMPGSWLNFHAYTLSNHSIFHIIILSLSFLTIFLLLLIIVMMQGFIKPLHSIKGSAEQLGLDLNHQPIKQQFGSKILQELNHAVLKLQQRVKDLLNKRAQLIAGISHDLRTPITRMKLRTQLLDNPELSNKFNNDLHEMEEMIKSTLSFAKFDKINEIKSKLDLNTLVLSICEDFAELEEAYIQFTELDKTVLFHGAAISLKRALTNIISNSIKYASHIQVELKCLPQYYQIIIKDNGPGIPETELNEVFKPYYKSNQKHKKRGSGLGLAISQEIIENQQGSIELSNIPGGGLCCLIILPVNITG